MAELDHPDVLKQRPDSLFSSLLTAANTVNSWTEGRPKNCCIVVTGHVHNSYPYTQPYRSLYCDTTIFSGVLVWDVTEQQRWKLITVQEKDNITIYKVQKLCIYLSCLLIQKNEHCTLLHWVSLHISNSYARYSLIKLCICQVFLCCH